MKRMRALTKREAAGFLGENVWVCNKGYVADAELVAILNDGHYLVKIKVNDTKLEIFCIFEKNPTGHKLYYSDCSDVYCDLTQ